MILRDATSDDFRPLLALCRKAWTHLGLAFDTDAARLRRWATGRRLVILTDTDDLTQADAILAALAAAPIETDRGPGYAVDLFVVDPENSDKVTLLDAISLYACNLALADRRPIITSRWHTTTPGIRYGRDLAGMDAAPDGADRMIQVQDAAVIAERIIERRPEWRP